MSKHEIEFKTLLDKAEAAEHLEKLVQCLKAGKIVVEKGDRFVSVSPRKGFLFRLSVVKRRTRKNFPLSCPGPRHPAPGS